MRPVKATDRADQLRGMAHAEMSDEGPCEKRKQGEAGLTVVDEHEIATDPARIEIGEDTSDIDPRISDDAEIGVAKRPKPRTHQERKRVTRDRFPGAGNRRGCALRLARCGRRNRVFGYDKAHREFCGFGNQWKQITTRA
jgi:hypothetical protein